MTTEQARLITDILLAINGNLLTWLPIIAGLLFAILIWILTTRRNK